MHVMTGQLHYNVGVSQNNYCVKLSITELILEIQVYLLAKSNQFFTHKIEASYMLIICSITYGACVLVVYSLNSVSWIVKKGL